MAIFNITSDTNWYDLVGRSVTGPDTINPAYQKTLTIDGDTRYGKNVTPTNGVIGSGINAGTLLIDATNVWLIPYSGGSGTVPIPDTNIEQGSVTAKLLGVWANLNSAPVSSGGAMPTTGYIKIRQKSGGSYSAGSLTGISATATGVETVGWIEVAGASTLGFSCNGSKSFWTARGKYFDIGVTNGSPQVFQAPASASVLYYGGVFIERSVGSGTFRYWPSVGQYNDAPQDERGPVCFASSNGTIRIGNNGTKNCGLVPPAGLRVCVPNIVISTTSSANYATNIGVATGTDATRFQFVRAGNTTGGIVDLECVVMDAMLSAVSTNYLRIEGCSIVNRYILSAIHTGPVTINNSGVGASGFDNGAGVTVFQISGIGMQINNFVSLQQGTAGTSISAINIGSAKDTVINDSCGIICGRTNASMRTLDCSSYSSGLQLNDFVSIGGLATVALVPNTTINNIKIADKFLGTQDATFPTSSIYAGQNTKINGISWVTSTPNTCHPYASVVTASYDMVKVRNVGTYSNPLSLGTANITGAFFSAGAGTSNLFLDRVHTTISRLSPQTSWNGSFFPLRAQNCTLPSPSAGSSIGYACGAEVHNVGIGNVTPLVPTSCPDGFQFGDFFTSATDGIIVFPLSLQGRNTVYPNMVTFVAPSYSTGTGSGAYLVAGGEVISESPWFVKGHTGFKNTTIKQYNGVPLAGLVAYYQLDTGSGYSGIWKNADGPTMSAETIDPVVGFRIKVKFTITSGSQNVRPLYIETTSSASAQQAYQYPMDTYKITINSLTTGSIVKIKRTDTNAVLYVGNESSGVVTYTTDYNGQVSITARNSTSSPTYKPWTTLATINGDVTLTALQELD